MTSSVSCASLTVSRQARHGTMPSLRVKIDVDGTGADGRHRRTASGGSPLGGCAGQPPERGAPPGSLGRQPGGTGSRASPPGAPTRASRGRFPCVDPPEAPTDDAGRTAVIIPEVAQSRPRPLEELGRRDVPAELEAEHLVAERAEPRPHGGSRAVGGQETWQDEDGMTVTAGRTRRDGSRWRRTTRARLRRGCLRGKERQRWSPRPFLERDSHRRDSTPGQRGRAVSGTVALSTTPVSTVCSRSCPPGSSPCAANAALAGPLLFALAYPMGIPLRSWIAWLRPGTTGR